MEIYNETIMVIVLTNNCPSITADENQLSGAYPQAQLILRKFVFRRKYSVIKKSSYRGQGRGRGIYYPHGGSIQLIIVPFLILGLFLWVFACGGRVCGPRVSKLFLEGEYFLGYILIEKEHSRIIFTPKNDLQ